MQVPTGEQPRVGCPVEVSEDQGKTWRRDVLRVYDEYDHSLRCEAGVRNRWFFFHGDPGIPRGDRHNHWRYIEMEM